MTGKPKTTPGVAKVSKTKIAREAAIAILVKADRAMTLAEIVEKTLTVKAVKDAGVPAGTISAQINFALAEDPPRIWRAGRALYAAIGVPGDATDATAGRKGVK